MAEEAFKVFDFDTDSEWQGYLSRVDIPAGVDQEKVKRKWFKKNKDASLSVEPRRESTPTASAPKPPPAASSQPQAEAPPPTAPEKEQPTTIRGFFLRQESLWLLMSVWLCFNVVAYFVPTAYGGVDQGYNRACNAAFLKGFSKFFHKHGFSFSGIMATCKGLYNREYNAAITAQKVVNNQNLHTAFIYFLFNSSPAIPFALFPIFLSSLFSICEWQSALLKLVAAPIVPYCDPILQNFIRHGKTDPETGNIAILYWNSWFNIAIAIVLFVELFTPARSFLLFIVYIQFLFIRHGSPDARHQRIVVGELRARTDALFHHDNCPGIIGKAYDMVLKGLAMVHERTGGKQPQR